MCKMNPKIYEFDAVLQKVDGIDGAYIEFPWDVKERISKGEGLRTLRHLTMWRMISLSACRLSAIY